VVTAPLGQTVLEALREAHIPHASVCGGRARCTTCRVRVRASAPLPEPASLEANALSRIHAEPDVRLACQLRPLHDVRITPLLPPHVDASQANVHLEPGRERSVAVMFVDLRESSRLGERRLPYDVFFIINRFFAEMQAALQATRGYYSTFNGDGFMALYGTTTGELRDACRDAMRGAIAVHQRLARLNAALAADLREPLRAGVSIHAGDAIVGTMGPPDHPILSALGDTVNVAARLEAETKQHGAMLIVSESCARAAGVDFASFPRHTASVRGRGEPVTYYVVADPRALAPLLDARQPMTTP
jgi:adenylate cyclase